MSANAFRTTPFHAQTSSLNQTTWWYAWNGYVVPDVYTDVHTEINAIRNSVSMNEMSPIPKMKINGPDSQRFVNYLITRNADKMETGFAWYTPWCNDDGKVVADGIVFRFEDEMFLFVGDNSISFFRQHSDGYDVDISDATHDYGMMAIQGPNSQAVLEKATGEGWSDLKFCRIRPTSIGGVDLNVARQGFTGEHGYELWVKREDGAKVWAAVAQAGQDYNIQAAGEYAIDIARVEAGLILVSADYTGAGPDEHSANVVINPADYITPFELGIGHCVNLNKESDFVGKRALFKEKENGPRKALVGIEIDIQDVVQRFLENNMAPDVSQRVRWDKLGITVNGEQVGQASSITWSPSTGRLIGFACLTIGFSEIDTALSVQWKDFWGKPLGNVKAKVVEKPFIDLKRS